ncbi:MAG: hypothetical protein KatS3mg105_4370 [Gemmatales bacterium]|nr:MAG: hypothetical protein KatS3mg105_4370 [Gemmatales bacterium]
MLLTERKRSLLVLSAFFFFVSFSPGQDSGSKIAIIPPADAAVSNDVCPVCPSAEDSVPQNKPFWATNPPVTPLPPMGNGIMFPSGPGYYSLRDFLSGQYRANRPKYGYPPISPIPPSFFDADFRYIDDPSDTNYDFFDPIKRMHPNPSWLISTGGDIRIQHKNELSSRLSGNDNIYQLFRMRLYGDIWYCDLFRVYAEFINADSGNQDLAPLPIDINRADFLNLFGDLKLWQWRNKPMYFRIGRQELLYGSQRLISPLDWANTRRTFEGIKGFWHGEKFNIDLFWVKPVLVSRNDFDVSDSNQGFAGLWTTYKPRQGHLVDVYYLFLDRARPLPAVPPGGRGGFNVNTVGARYYGRFQNNFLADFEAMYQFGDIANSSIFRRSCNHRHRLPLQGLDRPTRFLAVLRLCFRRPARRPRRDVQSTLSFWPPLFWLH